MDSFDLFKKLTTNLVFNKDNILKKNNQKLLIRNEKSIEETKDTSIKRKRNNSENSTINESDDDAIDILTNVKTTSAEINDSTKKSKKNRKKLKTREDLARIKQEHINYIRNLFNINVHGDDVPEPIETFDKLFEKYPSCPQELKENFLKYNFNEPTSVQMQAIPCLLNNRELLASAPTGSGKTLAYLFPILFNLREHSTTNGTRALILAPTRELVRQIYTEALRLMNGMSLKIQLISNKLIKTGSNTSAKLNKFDLLITTPNRLIYLINRDEINLSSVEWLVVDEADKMFEENLELSEKNIKAKRSSFREQLGVIYKTLGNPRIKHAMFSATFTKDVEEWARLQLNNVIQVTIGVKNSTHDLIEQKIQYVGNEHGKLYTLRDLFKQGFEPPILIFVQSIDRAQQLFKELIYDGLNVDCIHSERTQKQRDNTIRAFRQGKIWVLICTELMGRGIDFKGVNLVINYDFPQSSISYIHRIGRTGRAGRLGKAITFYTDDDLPYLKLIANIMRQSGCEIPDFMLKLKQPSKKLKRKLMSKAPKRKKILTQLPVNENKKINDATSKDANANNDKTNEEESNEIEKDLKIKKRKPKLMRIKQKISFKK